MTRYSDFRIERVLSPEPDSDIPEEVVEAIRKKLDRLISDTLCPPPPPPAPELPDCGCRGALHRSGCRMWCYT